MSNPIVIPDLEEYPEKYDDVVITEDLQEDWQKDPEIKAAFDRMNIANITARNAHYESLSAEGKEQFDAFFKMLEESVVRKFRKKPVTIEAMQLTDSRSVLDIEEWMNSGDTGFTTNPPTIWIKTKEGIMEATAGDWIIKGVEGEFYPCKPSIFDKTYQEV